MTMTAPLPRRLSLIALPVLCSALLLGATSARAEDVPKAKAAPAAAKKAAVKKAGAKKAAPAAAEAKAAPAATPAPAAAAEVPALKLVLPSPLGVERAKEDAKVISAILTKTIGRAVTAEVVAGSDIPKMLASGQADLAFVSAMQYVEASDLSKGKVAPAAKLVRGGLPFYRSVLFARADQKTLRTPKDLKDKKLAFVNEGSASGFQLPRLILLASGLTDAEIRKQGSFLGDHAAVCKAVIEGRADAGATISNDRAGGAIAGCAETEPTRVAELRVIATSDPIPNDVVAVRPDLDAGSVQAVRNALIALDNSPEGKKALADVFTADGFVAADDSDFAMLRATLKP